MNDAIVGIHKAGQQALEHSCHGASPTPPLVFHDGDRAFQALLVWSTRRNEPEQND
jgi:hypothetical protein